MKKLLTIGVLTAAMCSAAYSEGTCPTGGFYAGAKIGWVNHKYKTTFKGDVSSLSQTTLDTLKKIYDLTYGNAATTLAATKKALVEKLVAQYKVTDNTPGAGGIGGVQLTAKAVALVAGSNYAALTGISKEMLKGAYTAEAAALNAATNLTLVDDAARAAAIKKYNDAVVANATALVEKIFKKEAVDGYNAESHTFVYTGAAIAANNSDTFETLSVKESYDKWETYTAIVTSFETTLKDNQEALTFVKSFATKDAAANKAEADRIAKLEAAELGLNTKGSRSKSKSGFIGEFIVGYDYRIENTDVMLGVDLGVGLDTSKCKLGDKTKKEAKDTNTQVKDVLEFKRQFYFIFGPRIGFMATPQLEVNFSAGFFVNRFKVDTKGMAGIYDHASALSGTARSFSELAKTELAKAEKAVTDNANDAAKKATAELYRDAIKAIPEVKLTDYSTTHKAHKKTTFSPYIGLGARYSFTPAVFCSLDFRYQPSTKIVDYSKTSNVRVKNQNFSTTVGFGFRFGE
jgi:hypothetical protein